MRWMTLLVSAVLAAGALFTTAAAGYFHGPWNVTYNGYTMGTNSIWDADNNNVESNFQMGGITSMPYWCTQGYVVELGMRIHFDGNNDGDTADAWDDVDDSIRFYSPGTCDNSKVWIDQHALCPFASGSWQGEVHHQVWYIARTSGGTIVWPTTSGGDYWSPWTTVYADASCAQAESLVSLDIFE